MGVKGQAKSRITAIYSLAWGTCDLFAYIHTSVHLRMYLCITVLLYMHVYYMRVFIDRALLINVPVSVGAPTSMPRRPARNGVEAQGRLAGACTSKGLRWNFRIVTNAMRIYACMHACMHAFMYVCICTYLYVSVCVCLSACLCAYVCIYVCR